MFIVHAFYSCWFGISLLSPTCRIPCFDVVSHSVISTSTPELEVQNNMAREQSLSCGAWEDFGGHHTSLFDKQMPQCFEMLVWDRTTSLRVPVASLSIRLHTYQLKSKKEGLHCLRILGISHLVRQEVNLQSPAASGCFGLSSSLGTRS